MSATDPNPGACVIVIGNEILSGRTRDENLPWLAEQLAGLGVPLVEARVIPDEHDIIVEAVNTCRARHAHVFTTGGIGPTHDDITTAAVAAAFGVAVVRDAGARARLQAYYGQGELSAARLKMADMPLGAELIDNPVSGAPGYRIGNVYVLAGVPAIMRVMFDSIRSRLHGGPPIISRTVAAFARESAIAPDLAAIQARFPQVAIGSYPFVRDGRFGTSIVLRGTDPQRLDAGAAEVRAMFRQLGAELAAVQ
ncbi:MAG: competence/damage-inducible protein A [Gammaproteobacteria bacterium]|nr:competence/damage-inducible protein A [Gammaproteobacteria bacterium]